MRTAATHRGIAAGAVLVGELRLVASNGSFAHETAGVEVHDLKLVSVITGFGSDSLHRLLDGLEEAGSLLLASPFVKGVSPATGLKAVVMEQECHIPLLHGTSPW